MIVDNGLTVPSGHFDYDGLESKLDYAKELGVQYMVCPMLPKTMWTSADGFKKAAEQFNKWGEQVQSMGMQFGFHNHNYEFQKFGNTTGFDILTKTADPKAGVPGNGLLLDYAGRTGPGRDAEEVSAAAFSCCISRTARRASRRRRCWVLTPST